MQAPTQNKISGRGEGEGSQSITIQIEKQHKKNFFLPTHYFLMLQLLC